MCLDRHNIESFLSWEGSHSEFHSASNFPLSWPGCLQPLHDRHSCQPSFAESDCYTDGMK